MKRAVMLALAVFAVGFDGQPAEAACARSDLEGIWRVYAIGASDGEAFTQSCVLEFDANGQIAPPRNRCTEDNGDVLRVSGQLFVRSACRMTGNFVQKLAGETVAECDLDGALSQEKTTAAALVDCDDGSLTSLDLIKR